MKRWILAVAALLVVAAGLVHADYVKIIVNLGVSKDKLPDQAQLGIPGMMPGGMMPGGMMPGGMPGGMMPGGMMPGGMPGMGPGAMGPGGMMPGGRFGGGQ